MLGNPDIRFLSIAQRSPAFAGAYIEDGRLHVRSTTGEMPEALDARDILPEDLPVQARAADHSWETLTRWHRGVYETLTAAGAPPWASFTISSRENRIVVGTTDRQRVRQALREAGIPPNVFRVVHEEPAQPVAGAADAVDASSTKTLRDEFRPVPGGVEIGGGGICTLGFNVDHWEFGRSFVTAAHCTAEMLTVTDQPFVQPSPGLVIGTEVFDHPDQCPESPVSRCRYSDAALIQYNSNVEYELGKIARPIEEGHILVVDGERFLIGHEEHDVLEGIPLQWVGRTTGLRKGEVKDTCSTVKGEDFGGLPDDLILWCQHKHSERGEGGDSGSPVFRVQSDGITVRIAGTIVAEAGWFWAQKSWFSPVEGIRKDVKPNSNLECDGEGTTLTGGCSTKEGSSGSGDCDDDPNMLDPWCEP